MFCYSPRKASSEKDVILEPIGGDFFQPTCQRILYPASSTMDYDTLW